jgi:hypothetical protein
MMGNNTMPSNDINSTGHEIPKSGNENEAQRGDAEPRQKIERINTLFKTHEHEVLNQQLKNYVLHYLTVERS